MKTFSRLTLAFLLLILVVPQVRADEPPENGKHVEYYENGKKKSEAHYKNGEADGLWTGWHDNGQKLEEGNYKNGEKEGLETRWYENGQKWCELNYKNGEWEGLSTYWHENGQKWREVHYKNGELDKLDSLSTTWLENGQKRWENNLKNGNGLVTYWYENGQKKSEEHYKDGNLVSASVWKPNGEPCPITKIVDGSGIVVAWQENGKKKRETHYKDGKPDGLEATWYENGKKWAEIHYKNGKQEGPKIYWYENGQKLREAHFKNGKADGLHTSWHENGKKYLEGHYKNGKADGLETRWHENGKQKIERLWKDGKLDGPASSWYENGQKKEEGHHKNDEQDGLWTEWDENGKKKSIIYWKDGGETKKGPSTATLDHSFSDLETSAARQMLADAQAKRVSEAANQNALIYFAVSLVICYVIFPVNDQRLLKAMIIIGATTCGYFVGQWNEERKGIDTDPMLAAEERADAQEAEAQIEKAINKMHLIGLYVNGLEQVARSVDQIQRLRALSLSSRNIREFRDQLESLLPTLQFLVDQIAHESKTVADFDNKHKQMGVKLILEISEISGDNFALIRGNVCTTIRNQNIRLPSDEAIAAQAAARQLVDWGYSEEALAPNGAIHKIEECRKQVDTIRKVEFALAASKRMRAMKNNALSKEGLDELVADRKQVDVDVEAGRDTGPAQGNLRIDISKTLTNLLGAGNVDGRMVVDAYTVLKAGGNNFNEFIEAQRKDIAKRGNIEVDRSKLDKITAELIEGGLTQDQIQRLLNDTAHYVEVQQRMAELNYTLEEFKDYAEVEAAGGIQAIVDRKVEQTKAASE